MHKVPYGATALHSVGRTYLEVVHTITITGYADTGTYVLHTSIASLRFYPQAKLTMIRPWTEYSGTVPIV